MLVVDLVGEVAQRQEVLMQKHADDLVIGVAIEDRIIGCPVQIQHQQGKAEHEHAEYEQDEEILDL